LLSGKGHERVVPIDVEVLVMPDGRSADRRLVVAGGLVLGFGFGGLVDGIVLHQVLQWHNLISQVETNQTLEGLQRNLFWDGVFHAAAAVLSATGLFLLWHARGTTGRLVKPMRSLIGLVLVGWGAFHVVDQLAFHLVLDLHDIREGVENPEFYNWGFFAIGIVIATLGWILLRDGETLATRASR
jgi:uncharacterized membrane protein